MPQCVNSVIVGADTLSAGAAGLPVWIARVDCPMDSKNFLLILGKAAPLHEPHMHISHSTAS